MKTIATFCKPTKLKVFWPASVSFFWFCPGIFLFFFPCTTFYWDTQCFGHNVTWTGTWRNIPQENTLKTKTQRIVLQVANEPDTWRNTELFSLSTMKTGWKTDCVFVATIIHALCSLLPHAVDVSVLPLDLIPQLTSYCWADTESSHRGIFLPVTGFSATECSEYSQALHQSHLKPSFAAQE